MSLVDGLLSLEEEVKVKVKNPGVSELPDGSWDKWSPGKLSQHFNRLSKRKGKQTATNAVLNIERWNKKRNPSLSRKARTVMDKMSNRWKKDEK